MCREHWYQLPKNLRDEIWRAFRAGDSAANLAGIRRAIQYHRDNPPAAPVAVPELALTTLLTCAICGAVPVMQEDHETDDESNWVRDLANIECDHPACWARPSTGWGERSEVMALWNNRPETVAAVAPRYMRGPANYLGGSGARLPYWPHGAGAGPRPVAAVVHPEVEP
jgi:hypothetical protein